MACPVKIVLLFVLNVMLSLYGSVCANKTNPYFIQVQPHEHDDGSSYHLKESEEKSLIFSIRHYGQKPMKILPVSTDPGIVKVKGNMTQTVEEGTGANITVKVMGEFLGRASIKFYSNVTPVDESLMYDEVVVENPNQFEWYEHRQIEYDVTVSRTESALSHSFTGVVILLVCLANVAMGCKTELGVVKEVLKKPVGPLTGMFSQFILMPLISLAVIYMLKFDKVTALGFFAMGCSPGGAASNAYTYLLAGDVSLSVTMTLCSTLLSLGMFPLWMFTVGTQVIYRTDVQIPYTNILYSLAGLIVPVIIGMLIQWKKPNWAKYIVMGIRPLMVIFFIFVFTVGVYANLYIFKLMREKPAILLAGALVPYVGLLFGGLVAGITRQSWKRIRTIAIETGIQNSGIAIVLLKVSLPAPDNDISIVAPIAAAIFMPIPMLIAIVWYEVYTRCYKKSKDGEAYVNDCEAESETESGTNPMGVNGKYHHDDGVYYSELGDNNNERVS